MHATVLSQPKGAIFAGLPGWVVLRELD